MLLAISRFLFHKLYYQNYSTQSATGLASVNDSNAHSVTCWFRVQDLSENDLGRETSSSRAIGDALKVNIGLQTLILARMNAHLYSALNEQRILSNTLSTVVYIHCGPYNVTVYLTVTVLILTNFYDFCIILIANKFACIRRKIARITVYTHPTAILPPPVQRCRTVCLNSFANRTSPLDNLNDRLKRLCLVSRVAAPCA